MVVQPKTLGPLPALIARFILATLFRLLGGITAMGTENIPSEGPVLICPNHLSDCDPLAIYVTCPRRDIYFIAKEDLFHEPVLGPAIRAFGAIPIKRDSPDRSAIRAAESVLRSGNVLVLFPEGRLSESGYLGLIQPGAAMIALRTGAPIVPVGLARTNRFLPYGHTIPQASRLPARVIYDNPIESRKNNAVVKRNLVDALTQLLEHRIRALTGQDEETRNSITRRGAART
jgi:1-acyl-sn-glycerol-3-phosphate acyltransferase